MIGSRVQQKQRMDRFMTNLFIAGAGFAVILLIAFIAFVVIQ